MKNAFFIILFMYVSKATAQTTWDSVKAVINNMFTAMKTADGEKLAACFTDNAILQTIAKRQKPENHLYGMKALHSLLPG